MELLGLLIVAGLGLWIWKALQAAKNSKGGCGGCTGCSGCYKDCSVKK